MIMEKKEIIFATSNEDKLREIRMILSDFDVDIIVVEVVDDIFGVMAKLVLPVPGSP